MEAYGWYLLKSMVWLTGFGMVYLLFLRNERYFLLNRLFLISGMMAALLFPLLSWHYTVTLPLTPNSVVIYPQAIAVHSADPVFTLKMLLQLLYLAGACYLLIRIIKQTAKVLGVIRRSAAEPINTVKLIRTQDYPVSFSFFTFIFVNPSINNYEMIEIMNHEMEHIRQRHWIDLVLFEGICILQWFNPAIWLYGRFIRQNHEYLADERALQHSASPAFYRAALLNQMFGGPVIALAHSFNYSLNTKRFNMMKNKMKSPVRKLKLLLILPLTAIVFYAFATPEYVFIEPTVTNQVANANPQEREKAAKDSVQAKYYITSRDKKSERDSVTATYNLSQKDNKKEKLFLTLDDKKEVKGQPLYVVDGVIRENGKMSDIPAADIQSVNVLKDGKATEKYGDKGKNGVIEITMKSGEPSGSSSKTGAITVVGYSTQKDQYKADSADFKHRSIKFDNDGVTINESNSEVNGQKREIRIHGSGEKPLIVVNGEVKKDGKISDIDPETIESISVLKDESANTVYGDKGKNGVILITLKDGKSSGIAFTGEKITVSSSGSSAGSSKGTGYSYSTSSSSNSNTTVNTNTSSSAGSGSNYTANTFVTTNSSGDFNFNGKHPLLILNGKIAENQDISAIPNEDIVSVSIYKQGKIVEKYGEKAKDGVVEVKTKKK
jgi:TonB-dependent SusC/RagA subfamily outer membrane receptor